MPSCRQSVLAQSFTFLRQQFPQLYCWKGLLYALCQTFQLYSFFPPKPDYEPHYHIDVQNGPKSVPTTYPFECKSSLARN